MSRSTIADRTLFSNLDFALTAGMRVGLVGPNGSGKTTLLALTPRRARADQRQRSERAEALQIVYFDQNRELDPDVTLRRALAPESDSVIYQDRRDSRRLVGSTLPVHRRATQSAGGRLSGGERARVLIARLMLQPADVLLLDEPTNDLDIPTLEILEESLLEFRGALVLVTHDRYMLDRVSTMVVGLDGLGDAGRFADYSQWEVWQAEQRKRVKALPSLYLPQLPRTHRPQLTPQKKKLSYLEAREYATLEERVAEAEDQLKAAHAAYEDPAIASDAERMIAAQGAKVDEAQKKVDELYARWAELETKIT